MLAKVLEAMPNRMYNSTLHWYIMKTQDHQYALNFVTSSPSASSNLRYVKGILNTALFTR